MSKFEGHSLGPWRRKGWSIVDGDGILVCKIQPWDESGCRIDDNADSELIAAAPDLLAERDRMRDALQDIADLQNHPQDVEVARAALKEAGE